MNSLHIALYNAKQHPLLSDPIRLERFDLTPSSYDIFCFLQKRHTLRPPFHSSTHPQDTCVGVLPVGLCRYKDTTRTVEMQYGETTTRWRTSLNTTWSGVEAGGGAVAVGLPVERSTPGQLKHIWSPPKVNSPDWMMIWKGIHLLGPKSRTPRP